MSTCGNPQKYSCAAILTCVNIRNVGLTISPHNHKEEEHNMSSRKRPPKQESTETTTPVVEQPVPDPNASEPAVAEPKADGQSFADRVGQRKYTPAPDPFLIAIDTVAGVRLFESKLDGQMAIKFGEGRPEEKPSQAVIEMLKEAGY